MKDRVEYSFKVSSTDSETTTPSVEKEEDTPGFGLALAAIIRPAKIATREILIDVVIFILFQCDSNCSGFNVEDTFYSGASSLGEKSCELLLEYIKFKETFHNFRDCH